MRWNGKATGVLNNVVIRNYLDYTRQKHIGIQKYNIAAFI
jgi:hypothetical protein